MSALGGALDDLSILDLFAGSGALGLEALSRGATEVVFVERSAQALTVLRHNVELLGAARQSRLVRGDAVGFARGLEPLGYDLALADPPYDQGYARILFALFRERPFARQLWVEHRTGEEIAACPTPHQRRYGDTTLSTLPAGE